MRLLKNISFLFPIVILTVIVTTNSYAQISQSDALQGVEQLRSNGVILSISLLDEKMMYVTVSREFYNMTAREKRLFGGLLSLAYPKKFITVADAYTEKLVLSILPNGYTRIIK